MHRHFQFRQFPIEAIFGLLGVILGWFLQYFTNMIGKVEVKRKYVRFDGINNPDNVLLFGYSISFTVHNTSGTSRVIKDISFSFYSNEQEIRELPLVEIQSNIDERSSINDITVPANTIITCSDMQHNYIDMELPHRTAIYLKYRLGNKKFNKVFLVGVLGQDEMTLGNIIIENPPRD